MVRSSNKHTEFTLNVIFVFIIVVKSSDSCRVYNILHKENLSVLRGLMWCRRNVIIYTNAINFILQTQLPIELQ